MSASGDGNAKAAAVIDRLFATIRSRKGADAGASYTASLFAGGPKLICRKVGEEAIEVTIEGLKGDAPAVCRESADLIYHLMVLWAEVGLTPDDVWAELARREGTSGHEEKASRGKTDAEGGA
jgi:phosphoribosyl-ATP pyrophosphohydrolase